MNTAVASAAAPLLETRGLTRQFGGLTAVQGVNFRLEAGEIRCLIGPNGAGKTTFFNLITAVLPPSAGEIRFQGRPITGLPVHRISRLGIARTFQVPNLFSELTALENVQVAAQRRWESFHPLRSVRRLPQVDAAATAALERVGLAHQAETTPSRLSHAHKKRLELAVALVCEPQLLLLDEPTAGMTAAETREIAQLIKGLAAHVTLLVVEHDIDFVREIAQRVTVFHQGSVLVEGSLAEIETNPTVREIYLGQGKTAC